MKDEELDGIARQLLLIPALVHRKMNRDVFKVALEDSKLNFAPHYIFILKILQDEGPMCMAEIGRMFTISKSQMTASTDKLIQLGWIERRSDENDRRKVILNITAAGDEVITEIDRNIKKHMRARLTTLETEDLMKLQRALQDMVDIHSKI